MKTTLVQKGLIDKSGLIIRITINRNNNNNYNNNNNKNKK